MSPRLRRLVGVPAAVALVAVFLLVAFVTAVSATVSDAALRLVSALGLASRRLDRWMYGGRS